VAAAHLEPRALLNELGRRGAGIRSGPRGVLDLLRGGRNPIRGTGFRPELADGTRGQARHFAGVACSVARFGVRATRLASVLRGDLPSTADGRLSELAIEFATGCLSGEIPRGEVGAWIVRRLCAQETHAG
jgi:hypothetical protein